MGEWQNIFYFLYLVGATPHVTLTAMPDAAPYAVSLRPGFRLSLSSLLQSQSAILVSTTALMYQVSSSKDDEKEEASLL